MDMTAAPETHDADRIFAMVDLAAPAPAPKKPVDMTALGELAALPAAWRAQIEAAGRKAYFGALADGNSKEAAIEAGKRAAGAAFDALSPSLPVAVRPAVEVVEADVAPPPSSVSEPPTKRTPKATGNRGVEIDEAGRARSQADVDALASAGFAPKEPLFDRGTMVLELGVENARKSRQEYRALPLVAEACTGLISKIAAEKRRIVEVPAAAITMRDDGRLVLGRHPGAPVIDVTEHGFGGMCERLGYGGAAYLTKSPVVLRAYNVEEQRKLIESREATAREEAREDGQKEPAARVVAARVRDRAPSKTDPGGPEAFAFVSPRYPAFDADKIAEAFALAMPENARGSVRYDAATTGARFEALFHTTVAPEHFVAGEVFRTGIRVRSNDSGDGSITVRTIALQNLCLNLIVLDRMGKEVARIAHVGSVDDLRKAFAAALEKSKASIAPFLRAWNYACGEDIAARIRDNGVKLPEGKTEIMRGVFAGILRGRRVKFPRVQKDKLIDELVASWELDATGATKLFGGVTRAAVVNAFTRTAQRWIDASDPWATDGIELDAARLLWGDGRDAAPAPLPFVDLDAVDLDELTPPPASAAGA